MFLTVNTDTYTVAATEDVGNASLFYIFPNEDGKHPYEFVLAFYGDGQTALKRKTSTLTPVLDKSIDPLPRYLSAPVNVLGHNPGPLHLHLTAYESNARLTLHSRLVKKYTPIDTSNWVLGREAFFINCARRRLKRDGYVCVKQRQRGRQRQLITACVSSKRHHDDRTTWMLFRLLHPSVRNESTHVITPPLRMADSLDDKEHEELREYEKVLGDVQARVRQFVLGDRSHSGATAAVFNADDGYEPKVKFGI